MNQIHENYSLATLNSVILHPSTAVLFVSMESYFYVSTFLLIDTLVLLMLKVWVLALKRAGLNSQQTMLIAEGS